MNEYYNPLRESFKLAKKIDSIAFKILILSAVLTTLNFIFNKYVDSLKEWAEILSNANTVVIVLFALLKFAVSYIVFHTSFDKRSDFVDNSFVTNYSSNKSNKYYNNDTIENGILRMGANSFESCYFTYNLAIKGLKDKWIINLIVAVIILFILVLGNKSGKKVNEVAKKGDSAVVVDLPIAYVNIDSLLLNYTFAKNANEALISKQENSRATLNQRARVLQTEMDEFNRKLDNNAFLSRERAEDAQKSILKKST